MGDDIVTRLRGECQCSDDCRAVGDPCIPMRAADEIERLRAELDRWKLLAEDLMKWSDPPKMDWANEEYRAALTAYWQVVRGD